MANPVYSVRDTGRNSANKNDVREMAENMLTSWTSVTTGTIAVTAAANTDASFTQPADTIIRNLIAVPAVTWTANAPLYLIQNSHGHAANQFVSTATTAGVVGGPATSEAIVIAATLYTASARTLYTRLTPLANNLATAATTVTYLVEFLHLGSTPDQ
mgnify:CR=1 FL=1